jgi:hypothetical protein
MIAQQAKKTRAGALRGCGDRLQIPPAHAHRAGVLFHERCGGSPQRMILQACRAVPGAVVDRS